MAFKIPDHRVDGEEYDIVDADDVIRQMDVPNIEVFVCKKLNALILFECDLDYPPLSRVLGIIHEIPGKPGRFYRNKKWEDLKTELREIYEHKQKVKTLAKKYNVKLN